MKPGVYVHIPFCEQRCYYCAFTVSVAPESMYEPYVQRLLREIELSDFTERPETIFLGGGTPSIIDGHAIRRIVGALGGRASEITIEVNPGTLDDVKLNHYSGVGINRISLGVQSFCDEDLKQAGRLHSTADSFRDLRSLRRCGFTNISIDLIAGIPNQTQERWIKNLDAIERTCPEHVSIYMLDVEERSAWGKDSRQVPSDDIFARFYEQAAVRLASAGYVHYEISNWAQPGFECRHNLKYWTGTPYRGFGIGAHSFNGSQRYWNTTSMTEYAQKIDRGELPIEGREDLTREMRIEEAFLLGLRRISGFDIRTTAAGLGFAYPAEWFERVKELEHAGLVTFDGQYLKLTPSGWLLAGGVTEELLWPHLLST